MLTIKRLTASQKRALTIILNQGGIGYASQFTEGSGKWQKNAAKEFTRRNNLVIVLPRCLVEGFDDFLKAHPKAFVFYLAKPDLWQGIPNTCTWGW